MQVFLMPQIWSVSVENAQKSIQDHLPPLNIHKLTILPPKPKFRDKPTSHMVSWTAWVEVLLGVVRDQRNKNQINNGWVSRNSTKKQSTQSRRSNFCLCGEISGTRTAAGLVDYHKYGQCTNHAELMGLLWLFVPFCRRKIMLPILVPMGMHWVRF